ncbi:hypothetical protein Tco_1393360 [Tanacetum coccineum]
MNVNSSSFSWLKYSWFSSQSKHSSSLRAEKERHLRAEKIIRIYTNNSINIKERHLRAEKAMGTLILYRIGNGRSRVRSSLLARPDVISTFSRTGSILSTLGRGMVSTSQPSPYTVKRVLYTSLEAKLQNGGLRGILLAIGKTGFVTQVGKWLSWSRIRETYGCLKNAGLSQNEDNVVSMFCFLKLDTKESISFGHVRNFMVLLPSNQLQEDLR